MRRIVCTLDALIEDLMSITCVIGYLFTDSMIKNLTDDLVQVRTNITALDTNLSNQGWLFILYLYDKQA